MKRATDYIIFGMRAQERGQSTNKFHGGMTDFGTQLSQILYSTYINTLALLIIYKFPVTFSYFSHFPYFKSWLFIRSGLTLLEDLKIIIIHEVRCFR